MNISINGKEFELKPHQTVIQNKNGEPYLDDSDVALVRDENKCIGCSLCRTACLEYNNLGIPRQTQVKDCQYFRPNGKLKVQDSNCTRCGQCVLVCPTGALIEKENIEDVKKDLADPKKIVVAQIAPSVRVSLSEAFGLAPAVNLEGKIIAALKKMGFDYIFDVNLGADFTTFEEAYDLMDRIKEKKTPLFTSCCPARVKYIEDFHPEYIGNITSVRSPQQCLAVLAKTYFAKKIEKEAKDISVVSIMPCIAKKFESRRSGEDKHMLSFDNAQDRPAAWDVDWVLTTRELIKMIKTANIDLVNIAERGFDNPLGEASGAGAIYGATGGVMESAIRTFAHIYNKQKVEKFDYEILRGMEGIKRATIQVGDLNLRVAVASTLKNAEKIIDEIKKGAHYDYVEVMACPGGCVGGGGQIKPISLEVIDARRKALYEIDRQKPIRTAHENPIVQKVYREFLECAGGPKAKELLHTDYDKDQARICNI